MPRHPRDLPLAFSSDTHEAHSGTQPGSSSRPLDLVRQQATTPSSSLPKPKYRAMSPGGTIYELGQPHSRQRKAFLDGPAQFTSDRSKRPNKSLLTGHHTRKLTRRTFSSNHNWESFTDTTILTRDGLNQAKRAHRSAASRQREEAMGAEALSAATRKGNETRKNDPSWNALEKQAKRRAAANKARQAQLSKAFDREFDAYVDLDAEP